MSCPTEVVELILLQMSVDDALSCRHVCRALEALVLSLLRREATWKAWFVGMQATQTSWHWTVGGTCETCVEFESWDTGVQSVLLISRRSERFLRSWRARLALPRLLLVRSFLVKAVAWSGRPQSCCVDDGRWSCLLWKEPAFSCRGCAPLRKLVLDCLSLSDESRPCGCDLLLHPGRDLRSASLLSFGLSLCLCKAAPCDDPSCKRFVRVVGRVGTRGR